MTANETEATPQHSGPWRVVLVDDHAIFRSSIKRLLSDEADLRVTGEASNGQEALEHLRQFSYDLILLDINMAGRSGLEVMERIRAYVKERD